MTSYSGEAERLLLQERLDAKKSQAARNKLGQYATPTELACEILSYAESLLPKSQRVSFLDPAFGTGSFYSGLLSVFGERRLERALAVEVDSHYGIPAKELWKDHNIDIRLADFTDLAAPSDENQRFNLIISNPPYVRHHHLSIDQKVRLQTILRSKLKIDISGLAGLYCYFLLLSHLWLRQGGLSGWLIPTEFLDVNYGNAVKEYLLKQVDLIHIHRFAPDEIQFNDALVSSAVVWFRNEPPKKEQVLFTFGGSLLNPKIQKLITRGTLQQRPKWSRLAEETSSYVKPRFRLGDYFKIKRGIATGDNSFFMLERERIEQLKLPIEFFRPILPSPRYLKSDEVQADSDGNPKLDPNLFVLNCRLSEQSIRENHPNLWRYLQSGKSTVGERYLCRARAPWYSQEEREPAPFLCTYMGRGRAADKKPFRFIFNRSKAIAANTYLMLYPKQRLQNAINRDPAILPEIWKFLCGISTTDMQSEGRVYGGGLYKMEPKELCNVNAEALEKMTGDSKSEKYTQLDLLSVAR